MKIIPICGVLVWTTITVAIGAPNQRVALAGFYYIENVKMIPFAIEAIMNPYNPKTYPNIHSGRYIGTDGGAPSYVCSAFAVSTGGREIRIPKKAYSDLEDILMITRMEREGDYNRWSAKIVEGSGAGSYELEFIFDSERLFERRFVQSEPEALLGENIPKSARRNHFNEMILSTEILDQKTETLSPELVAPNRAETSYAEYHRQKASGSQGRGFRLPLC